MSQQRQEDDYSNERPNFAATNQRQSKVSQTRSNESNSGGGDFSFSLEELDALDEESRQRHLSTADTSHSLSPRSRRAHLRLRSSRAESPTAKLLAPEPPPASSLVDGLYDMSLHTTSPRYPLSGSGVDDKRENKRRQLSYDPALAAFCASRPPVENEEDT